MPIRLTGMNSGLDTETIIAELVKAQSVKKDKLYKKQQAITFKQDAWKGLNTKLNNLYKKTVDNLRWTPTYSKKKTTSSNDKVASIITGDQAMNGTQTLKDTQIAKAGYLTGAKLGTNSSYTSQTKLSEIDGSSIGADENVSFAITAGGKTVDINLTGSSTIQNAIDQLNKAGVTANFDEQNQRIYIASTTTGKDADFALTASNAGSMKALTALGINVADKATMAQYEYYANLADTSDPEQVAEKAKLIEEEVKKREKALLAALENAEKTIKDTTERIELFEGMEGNEYLAQYGRDIDALGVDIEALEADRETLVKSLENESLTEDDRAELTKQLIELDMKLGTMTEYSGSLSEKKSAEAVEANALDQLDNDNAKIIDTVTNELNAKIAHAQQVIADPDSAGFNGKDAQRVQGQNAKITLNEVDYESDSNTFEINGLTITVLAESKGDEITLHTADDFDAVYDVIKGFIKEYNSIINEMDKLYNAANNSDYQPLTEEEKDAMSESEIAKWEEKIKESALRRDPDLSAMSSMLKSAMSKGYEVDGKTMYLWDFGINTLGFFDAADNEKNAYYIDGDPDSPHTSGKEDKLRAMLASDPDTVVSFFKQMANDMYGSMNSKIDSRSDYSGYGKAYNDKQLEKEYNEYAKKIAEQEKKLQKMEDKYYKQFSAMEVALAKMDSKQNAILGMLGVGG